MQQPQPKLDFLISNSLNLNQNKITEAILGQYLILVEALEDAAPQ